MWYPYVQILLRINRLLLASSNLFYYIIDWLIAIIHTSPC